MGDPVGDGVRDGVGETSTGAGVRRDWQVDRMKSRVISRAAFFMGFLTGWIVSRAYPAGVGKHRTEVCHSCVIGVSLGVERKEKNNGN